MMMRLSVKTALALLTATAAMILGACSSEGGEETNAGVVNIEKGVASPVSLPEGYQDSMMPESAAREEQLPETGPGQEVADSVAAPTTGQ